LAATLMAKEPKPVEYARYSVVKLDSEVLPRVRAAANLKSTSVQEWLSDLANLFAAKELRLEPLPRKKPKPRSGRPRKEAD